MSLNISQGLFMKFHLKFIFTVFAIFFSINVFAANSVDFIVVVDQSRSIKNSLPNIKDFISKRIFNDIAKPEDSIHLLSFDGQFYTRGVLRGSADIIEVGYTLDTIKPVGGYTDLTNAVLKMSHYIETKTDNKRRKIIFFLTDGLNEPPQYSIYQGDLKHDFFVNSNEKKQENGWVMYVTGIGENTDAESLALLTNSEYIHVNEEPTLEEFEIEIADKLIEARKEDNTIFIVSTTIGGLLAAGGASFFVFKRIA
jgi:hypothetical protein